MGHSSIQVSVDIYGDLVPGANRQAVDKLDDARICNLGATGKAEGVTLRLSRPAGLTSGRRAIWTP
jgi:hypothetical protein